MTEPSDRLAALVEAEARLMKPSEQSRARNWAAVSRGLGLPPTPDGDGGMASPGGDGTPPGLDPVTGAAALPAKGSALLKSIVVGTLAIATTASIVSSSSRSTDDRFATSTVQPTAELRDPPRDETNAFDVPAAEPPPERADLEPDDAPAGVGPKVVARPERAPAKKRSEPGVAAPEVAPTSTRTSTLAAELELVRMAKRALDRGDFAAVLTITDRHAQEFTRGDLEPDVLGLRAAALCRLGRRQQGLSLLTHIRDRWPRAPIGPHAHSACKDDP